MSIRAMQGTIERRLLVNYRVDAETAARMLPHPFRPQLVDGFAVAGICLLRLGELRPRGMPRWLGLRSENVAHRIAVEWDTGDGLRHGVYIPRRDSAAVVNRLAGGRLFPGAHHSARINADETRDTLSISVDSDDQEVSVDLEVEVVEHLESSLFGDLKGASRFFEAGSVGYSDSRHGDRLEGVELRTNAWEVRPMRVTALRSSLFEDRDRFPPGTAALDCALLMRDVPVTWHALPSIAVRQAELR